MAPWTVVARSFRPAPRIPGIASDAPPPPRSRDTHSREDLGSPAPAHRAPGASGDHIRGTQTPCEQACAAPTASASSPLRPVRADTPGTPATTESQSILCASTAECTQKSHLTESSTFEGFPEFLRRALISNPNRYRRCCRYSAVATGQNHGRPRIAAPNGRCPAPAWFDLLIGTNGQRRAPAWFDSSIGPNGRCRAPAFV